LQPYFPQSLKPFGFLGIVIIATTILMVSFKA